MHCPTCGFDSPPGMKYCGRCGTHLGKACATCGFTNPVDYQFCGECGTRFAERPVALQSSVGEALAPQPELALEAPVPPEPSKLQLEGERRLATVLVADVTGSTDLLEQIGTEAWVEIMNQVLHILESEVYRFGGHVDQFRGDGLVAFFGAASAHEDDPERAVLAGLAMHTALEYYAVQLAERQNIELQVRVGVNTGDVIVTSVGDSRLYREDTVMGEAVALAARLEGAAEPGTVLVSENTYRLVEPLFEWQPLGDATLKGVSQPVAVYRPLAPQADSGQAYGVAVPLIGRDDEFQMLQACVEGLYAGRGGIALVSGERGMGKSFLVTELRQHFARHGALLADAHDGDVPPPAALTWLRGRCRSYDQSWPYSMWLSLFRDWLGIRRGEPKEAARDRLRHQAEVLWGDQWVEYYPYLATFLSLPLEGTLAERLKHLDAEGLRQQFFPTIRSWLEAMAQRGPLVLEFADVQWADTTSLDLLKYCLTLCDHEALLWLIVFRPERTSPVWGFQHHVETEYPHRLTVVTLPPLTGDQSGEFIDKLIGPDALPAETRDLVIGKAEGNPFYIGELVRSLIAQGTVVQKLGTGKWHVVRAVDSLDLPDSLQSLLLARIDRLSPEERYVLQMAAVIGSVFWSDVLEALADGAAAVGARPFEASALKGHLTALQREQLIHERGRVPDLGMEYVFTSNLIRDVAYESLLQAHRITFHRQVAEYLERHLSEKAIPHFYGVLAYQFQCAGELPNELRYNLLAAEQAQGIYANVEAAERYTRALELLGRMEKQAVDEGQLYSAKAQRFEVLNERRKVYLRMGDYDAVRADAQDLLSVAHQLKDDPVRLIDALLQQSDVAFWATREELEAGCSMAEEALSLAQALGDRRREMQSLAAIANQRLWVSDPIGWEVAGRALELARQLGDQRYEVGILTGMGRVYEWSDHPEQGMAYLEAALPISRALDDRIAEIDLLYLIGLQFERNGDYCRLLTEFHEKRLNIAREIGHRPLEAAALMQCGQIQSLYLGDYESGLSQLESSRRLWEGTPNEMYAWLRIAQVYVAEGRHDDALAALGHANRIARVQAVQEMGHAGLYLVSATLYNALGKGRLAEDSGDQVAYGHLLKALEFATKTRQLVEAAPLTRQYELAAACEAAVAHLGLAACTADEGERLTDTERDSEAERPSDDERLAGAKRQHHLVQALEASQAALNTYEHFGFVQVIECLSEEILYRRSLALAANGREAESVEMLQRAYDEMMRKHDLIPPDSRFRRTFLENIPLHREIRDLVLAVRGDERGDKSDSV